MKPYLVNYSFMENNQLQTTAQDFATLEEANTFCAWLYGQGNLTEISLINVVDGTMYPLTFATEG